jgi:hypothetical protein
MLTIRNTLGSLRVLSAALAFAAAAVAQQPAQPAPAQQPAVQEWGDEFDGDRLDEAKWEPFTFDGGGVTKLEVKDGQLKLRGAGISRAGVRTKETFQGDRFYVEAAVARVGNRTPGPGEGGFPPGYAIVTVLFDGNSRDRLEWLIRSDGLFEAWQSIDGKIVRLDDNNLATKEKKPRLGIARRGDQVFFMLNREVGLQNSLRGLSPTFKVMLYGFGSSENDWDSLYVQTPKQQ